MSVVTLELELRLQVGEVYSVTCGLIYIEFNSQYTIPITVESC